MDVTPEKFEDLIGAYALDALEPDEVDALDAYVAGDPRAAAEVERLRDAAAALGAIGAVRPPIALKERLLQLAAERVAAVTPREALQAETDRLDALLATVTESDVDTVTHNGLTIQDLVSHVEAVDCAFVESAGDAGHAFIGADQVAPITEAELPKFAGETFAETVRRYRITRNRLINIAEVVDEDVPVAGYRRDTTLEIRAFETWTHTEDIQVALGRKVTPAEPAVMRSLAELAMRTMPMAMAVRGTAHPERTARLVLTGPGGGEFTIPCGPSEAGHGPADVVIKASVVDWCRRFADRLEPDAVAMEVDGDAQLARELVTAANAFAGL
jgi:uncharacterized protein (TIGR03083 family)